MALSFRGVCGSRTFPNIGRAERDSSGMGAVTDENSLMIPQFWKF
jgi:hypothetical protein